jgi:hypothetical protein
MQILYRISLWNRSYSITPTILFIYLLFAIFCYLSYDAIFKSWENIIYALNHIKFHNIFKNLRKLSKLFLFKYVNNVFPSTETKTNECQHFHYTANINRIIAKLITLPRVRTSFCLYFIKHLENCEIFQIKVVELNEIYILSYKGVCVLN